MCTVPSLSFSSETVSKTGMPSTPIFGMSSERVLSSGPPGFRPKWNGLTTGMAPGGGGAGGGFGGGGGAVAGDRVRGPGRVSPKVERLDHRDGAGGGVRREQLRRLRAALGVEVPVL